MKRIDELTLLLVDNNISDIELTELAELIEAKEEFDNFAGLRVSNQRKLSYYVTDVMKISCKSCRDTKKTTYISSV